MAAALRDIRGATKHHTSERFEGVLAFSNVGLAGKEVTGKKWPEHEMRLGDMVSDLFIAANERGRELLGVLLNEVGSTSDPVDEQGIDNIDNMMTASFQRSCNEEPQLFWGRRETMAAFRPEVEVQALPTLDRMKRVDSWRIVERFAVSGVTEHGRCKLLVFNQYQPQSNLRPFRAAQMSNFCKESIRSAMRYCDDEPECVWVSSSAGTHT